MKVKLQDLGRSVKRLQDKHHSLIDRRLRAIGCSLPQWDVLRAIALNPGVSSHALAEYTFQTDQAFGTLIKRLIAKALVKRSAGGGRVLNHALTERGQALLGQASEVVEAALGESFSPLSQADRKVLMGLLERLLPD